MRPSPWLIRVASAGGAIVLTALVLATSWVATTAAGRPFTFWGSLAWNAGFLLWAGLTFLAAYAARRFPFSKSQVIWSIVAHCLCGTILALLILSAELSLNRIVLALWPGATRPTTFLSFISYKFHVHFLIYWLVIGATQAYDHHIHYRESVLRSSQLEARLAEARLTALQAQIHPHFLFNTLNAVVSLVVQNENTAAVKMLTRLSDLLRHTLRETERQMTTLREELTTLDLYLEIQQVRYGERLRVVRHIDPAALDFTVPALLLQPLVENAIRHGLDPLPEGGTLTIRAERRNTGLAVSIEDTGRGLPDGFDLANASGIGLRNTRARLESLYRGGAALTLASAGQAGTRVMLELPSSTVQPGPSPNLVDA